MNSEQSIQHKPIHLAHSVGFDDDGQPVPVYSPSLPLEHQLLDSLRGVDLENDRAQAIREIERAFDQVEVSHLAQVFDWLRGKLGEKSVAWRAVEEAIGVQDNRSRNLSPKEKVQRWLNRFKDKTRQY